MFVCVCLFICLLKVAFVYLFGGDLIVCTFLMSGSLQKWMPESQLDLLILKLLDAIEVFSLA